jgi:hypothetical protein
MACGYGASGVFAGGICEDVKKGLLDLMKDCNTGEVMRSKLGFTQALMSDFNMKDASMIPLVQDNKHKTVRITYLQRAVQTQVTDACSSDCTGDFDDLCETTFTCTTEKCMEWQLDRDEFLLVCEGTEKQFADRLLMSKFDAFAQQINSDILTTLSLNFGVNQRTGNNAVSAVNVLTAGTDAPIAVGLNTIKQDYEEFNNYCGMPIIVGQGQFARYNTVLNASCCNDGGIDFPTLLNKAGFAFFLDTQFNANVGNNQFAVLAPGTFQLAMTNRVNSDSTFEVSPLSAYTRVIDPFTGISYDWTVIYKDCDREWYFKLELCYDLFVPPSDQFNAADPLSGINGATRYRAV